MATATANAAQRKSKVGRVRTTLGHIDLAQRVPEAGRAHDQLGGEEQRRAERAPPTGPRCDNVVHEPGCA